MKFIPIKTDCDFEFGLEPYYDRMNEIQKEMSENISRKREDQIIQTLEKRGYTFQNKEQLYEFAKRCEIRMFEEKPDYKELWYENELVCMWDEKITIEHEHNKITSTITVRVG